MATGVLISSFAYVGVPTLSAIFGFFKTSSGAQIQRIQITAQIPPVGGSITVQLIDQSGTAYSGATITLESGNSYYDQPLAAPISLGLSKIVRAQITSVDLGVGSDLVVNLIGATTQGATPPSGCGPSNCQPPSAQLLFFQGNVQPQVEQAQQAADEAEASAADALASKDAAAAAQVAAEAAKASAETAETNAEAQVALAAGYATNANNAATASSVYANNSQSSASAAAVSALEAALQAADAQTRKAATLQLTPASTQTIPDATPTAVAWDNAQFDDLIFFSAANPTRLTIPTNRGITRVRLSAGIRWTANATGERKIKIRGNGGTYPANSIFASDDRPSDASGDATIQSGVILVQDGMYFEVLVEQNSGGGLDLNNALAVDNYANFFTIEVMARTL